MTALGDRVFLILESINEIIFSIYIALFLTNFLNFVLDVAEMFPVQMFLLKKKTHPVFLTYQSVS